MKLRPRLRFALSLVLIAGHGIAVNAAAPPPVPALNDRDDQELVIVDEDWNAPGDHICEAHLPLLLVSPHVKVLALTATSGDTWCPEGVQNILRFLEEIGRPDIPVAAGAVFPLVNTQVRIAAWEKQFGALSWKGAWNPPDREEGSHPDAPFAIRLPREGPPSHLAVAESAPD